MSAWYQTDRGENIEGQGVSGCMARLFLKHMIGHVLVDMDNMTNVIEQDARDNLQWQVICFPGNNKNLSILPTLQAAKAFYELYKINTQLRLFTFVGLRKRSSDGKELQWQIDSDMVTEIVQKYPMYKTKYYTVAFCDAASIMLKITEEKYGLPKNRLIAVSNKY